MKTGHRVVSRAVVDRWTPASRLAAAGVIAMQVLLTFGPFVLSANLVDRLTTLFIYGILALMWNALAGYAGLVSVGHQAFFGLGAYAAVRLADAGLGAYPSLLVRDEVIKSGMAKGAAISYDRLEEITQSSSG